MKLNALTSTVYPYLFSVLGCLSTVIISLVSHEIKTAGSLGWPSDEYRNRVFFVLSLACWTLFGTVVHWFINMIVGLFWTFLTFILWIIAAALYSQVDPFYSSHCEGAFFKSECGHAIAIGVIGWVQVSIALLVCLALFFYLYTERAPVDIAWSKGDNKDPEDGRLPTIHENRAVEVTQV